MRLYAPGVHNRCMNESGSSAELHGILAFLRAAEALKTTHRSGRTSAGRPESVAEHSWRLCLMALALHAYFPGADFGRLAKICIVHDLGEALGGDVPAPEQAASAEAKADVERRDLRTLVAPLPAALREEIVALWEEYEAGSSVEARVAKALDKLETILQHVQGANPPDFDHAFNLSYGRALTDAHPVSAALRELLDEETSRLAGRTDGAAAPGR